MSTLERNGRSIGFEVYGNGSIPILGFHGTTQARNAWDQVRAEMGEQFQWVVCEFPGSGESSMPDGPLHIDDLVDDGVAVMESVGLSQFHVAGYSLGAVVALHAAATRPESVMSVTSLCGWSRTDARMRLTFDLWRRLIAIGPDMFMRYALVDGYTAGALEMLEPMAEAAISMAPAMVQPGSDAHLELDSRIDIEDSLEKIRAACLVIAGSEDRWVDVTKSRHIADRVKNSRLLELPAGHLVIGEMAAAVASAMAEHIHSQHERG